MKQTQIEINYKDAKTGQICKIIRNVSIVWNTKKGA